MDKDGCLRLIIYMLTIVIAIVGFGIFSFVGYMNEQTTICKVEEKWVKRKNKTDLYLISCGNEVYKIEDLFFKGKFNSSDIYSKIKTGKKYKITTTGYRLQFFSEYKNINKIKEVS